MLALRLLVSAPRAASLRMCGAPHAEAVHPQVQSAGKPLVQQTAGEKSADA